MSFLRNQIVNLKATFFFKTPQITFFKIFYYFSIFIYTFFLIYCSGKNLKLQGEPNRLSELPFYGAGFYVSASKIEKEDLVEIRKDLKNELASRIPKDRIERWKEADSLNGSEGIYILFQIVPETRVLPEFLDFQFYLNDVSADKIWNYYVQSFTAKVRNYRFSALPVYGTFGYPFYTAPPGVYSSGTFVYDSDVTTETEHIYRFLVRFPKDTLFKNSQNKIFFQVVTPAKSILRFEY
ncbi:hypothetical protein ACO2J1_16895 [Leptospira interrogans]|uniref:Uncharacterized protein n=16 Tax=Leptospira interrogans TaxID=173 RepID=Q8F0Y7_LEPIN|nr:MULTISPECIES: hypothetical protein [Leptospira]EMF43229.1 hypothetical protein LEP1GSC067_4178 [Leptospira interrogans serovar Lora str. TE 1992]EMN32097.1 hypothetical protein LEP1GSC083_2757 [Leptospira interrogans serovar Pyrogenes str. L0374]KAA1269371.1 hypothetical protein C5473_16605 [Leptospira interrogans serovar Weerasinghe]AAN50551.1 hypothetical protein LA_3353 [Leptospira interrogans serovar Lai str. 56601]AAS69424.1 conserved hypothetical protein [Leptospira interrogans serova